MNARKKLLDFLASNPDMLTPQQSQCVEALREPQAHSSALALGAGSAAQREGLCENCTHWEPDKTGLRPYMRGYCPIFDKQTDAIHGYVCTAHQFSPPIGPDVGRAGNHQPKQD